MLRPVSIKALYGFALAEGEGIGTAYEYYVKRLLLWRWLRRRKRPGRILIAGLPEKYGASMDFLLLSQELGSEAVVVDDRAEALERLRSALASLQRTGKLAGLTPEYLEVGDLRAWAEEGMSGLTGSFDLALSSEVLQRLSKSGRAEYIASLRGRAASVAIFAPNADNAAHTTISGLASVSLGEMAQLFGQGRPGIAADWTWIRYLDMPPFPPGITRSEVQRAEASTGALEALAMWGLAIYARVEGLVPAMIRGRYSHIVAGLAAGPNGG